MAIGTGLWAIKPFFAPDNLNPFVNKSKSLFGVLKTLIFVWLLALVCGP